MLLKILLIWGVTLVVICAGAVAYPKLNGPSSDFFLEATSSLLGIVSYILFRVEKAKHAKLVFLNFALLFATNGLVGSLYQLVKREFFLSDVWSDFYFFEYYRLLYFLLLFLCVFWLIADHIPANGSTHAKYLVSLGIVISVWMSVFHSFIIDPEYVYKVPDVRNFVAVREIADGLKKDGNLNPSAEEIASEGIINIQSDIDPQIESSRKHQARYVGELQQYLPGDNYRLLLFKPLFLCCSQMGLLSVFSILFYIVFQYLVDSPKSAYMEKIVWCLLPYCGFEALHMFVFTRIIGFDLYVSIMDLGGYMSMAAMFLLLVVFGARLRFIQTVEGMYYERRLITDSSRITRWRDALDNWVLKQFMNPGDLDRRFLRQRKTEE